MRRRSLLKLLEESDADVTLIQGPAGSGKTTLAAQYLHDVALDDTTTAWLTIDRTDNDVETLVRHIADALYPRLPSIPIDEIAGVLEAHGDRGAPHGVALLGAAIGGLDAPAVLVLDDCHTLTAPAAADLVADLIRLCAPGMHFVLTSRGRPGIPLSSYRLRDALLEIGPSDLKFTPEEVGEMLAPAADAAEPSGELESLAGYVDGWAAGLQLLNLSLTSGTSPKMLRESLERGHGSIAEFLTESVLATLDERLLSFLQDVSVCDRLSASLAAALTDRADAGHFLEELEERSLFLTRSSEDPGWYRLHQAFRDFLRSRLRQRDPERVQDLHRRASDWLADHGYLDAALYHAQALSPEAAVDLVERFAMSLIQQSRMATLLRLAAKIPAEQRETRFRLMLAVAWANSLLQRVVPAQVNLDHARAVAPDGAERDEALAEIDVVQACIDIFRDRSDRIPSLIGTTHDEEHYGPFVRGVAANALMVGHLHRGEFAAARDLQYRAHHLHHISQGPFSGVYGRTLAGIAALEQLDLDEAVLHLSEAMESAETGLGQSSHATQLAGALRGEICIERGDGEVGRKLLESAIGLSDDGGIVEVLRSAYGTLARCYAADGRTGSALELIGEGLDVAARLDLRRLAAALRMELTRIQLAGGDPAAARRTVAAMQDRSAQLADRPGSEVPAAIAAALVHTASGEHQQAISGLEGVLAAHADGESRRRELLIRGHLAAALERAGRPRRAGTVLEPILPTAVAAGAVGTLRAVGPDLRPVLERYARSRESLGTWTAADRRYVEDVCRTTEPTGEREAPARVISASFGTDGRRGSSTAAPTREASDDSFASEPINEREESILVCLEQGMANRDIAKHLSISVNTVKWHLKNIYLKLGASSRLSAVAAYRRRVVS